MTLFLIALLVGACATPSSEQREKQRSSHVGHAHQNIQRIPPKELSESEYASRDPVYLSVRKATQADLESDRFRYDQKIEASLATFGVGSVGLGVAAGPMFGGGLILGGIFVGIASSAIAATEGQQQGKIELALRQIDLVGLLERELDSKLHTSRNSNEIYSLEIIPLRYGIVEGIERTYELCVVAELVVTLRKMDQALYQDRVLISPYLRSEDAPAPVCMSRENMSFEDARPLRDALAIYAVTIPAIIQRRIPGLPWKH